MKLTILTIVFFLCTAYFYSCGLLKPTMQNREGNIYAIQEGDNYPLVVKEVEYHNCSGYYAHKIEKKVFYDFFYKPFKKGDTLLLVEKSYLDSLIKK